MSKQKVQQITIKYCSVHKTELIRCKYHQGYYFCPACEHIEINTSNKDNEQL